jgi:predicted Ser/Thr protein kinase
MFLNGSTPDDPERVLQLARAELRQRLERGEECCAEDLLALLPALSSHASLAIDLVYEEFVLRGKLGQQPRPEDWLARFPQWQEQLRRQFQIHGMLHPEIDHSAATTPDTPPQPGVQQRPGREAAPERFGDYELLEKLGEGGMGVVYKARDTVLGRIVALKRMGRGKLALPQEIERFYREARAAAQSPHPHIVPVYDFGEHAGEHYLTMAFVSGGSLADHRERFAEPRAAVALLEKVARAVQAAHEKGIIHRDLKPANVLLDEQGEPLVSDFGLAKRVDDDVGLTHTGDVLGTPAYMAPEQAAGRISQISARTDVWALGVMLYELLTGQRPFAGPDRSAMTVQIQSVDPPPPRTLRPQVDRALELIVLKCLEKDPEQRYRSAQALVDDLQRWQRGERISARPEGWPRRLRRSLLRGSRWRVLAATGLGLALLLGGVLLLSGPRSSGVDRLQGGDQQGLQQQNRRQEEALADIQRQLAEGQPVTLLPATGLPRAYSWRTDRDRPPLERQREQGPLFLESWRTGLLELVPGMQIERYEFSADVLPLSTNRGYVGIYVLADEVEAPDRPLENVFAFTFAREGQHAGKAWVFVGSYQEGILDRPPDRSELILGSAPLVRDQDWQRLAIEVTPEQITASWEGRIAWTLERTKVQTQINTWWAVNHPGPAPPARPRFSPHGGLGLLVDHGSAQFRNALLIPK